MTRDKKSVIMNVSQICDNGMGGVIMVNVKKLKEEMEKKGITVSAVADKLQLSPSTLYRKLQSGGESLTVRETAQIADMLRLSTKKANEIFFGN